MRKKWRLRHKTNRGKREFPRDKRRAADIFRALLRPYGLAVRTPPFHGGSPGSIPGRVAISHTRFIIENKVLNVGEGVTPAVRAAILKVSAGENFIGEQH